MAAGTVLPPLPPALADWNDRRAAAIEDCGVAAAGIKCPVAGHGAYLFIRGNPVLQMRQIRAAAPSLEVNSTAWMSPVAVSIAR